MRALLVITLATLASCGGTVTEEVTPISVRLSLDPTSCPSPTMMTTGSPADISLACGTARVGQFVKSGTQVLASQCEPITSGSGAPTGTPTLADVPRVLAGFQSPELDPDTTITVRLEISVDPTMPGTMTPPVTPGCMPSDPASGGTSPAVSGDSLPVTLGDGVESIDVTLRCNGPPPC